MTPCAARQSGHSARAWVVGGSRRAQLAQDRDQVCYSVRVPFLDTTGQLLDLRLRAGQDQVIRLELADAQGVPLDLTGYTSAAKAVNASGTVTFDTTISDAAVVLTITHEVSADMRGGYAWVASITDGAGLRTPFAAGQLTVIEPGPGA